MIVAVRSVLATVSVVDATVASATTVSELADESVDEATVAVVASEDAAVSSALTVYAPAPITNDIPSKTLAAPK